MSSIDRITETGAKHTRDPVIQGAFSYDVQAESWAWNPVVRTDHGYDYLGLRPDGPVNASVAALIPDQIPYRAAVLEAMDSSIQHGTPFSLGHSVVDDAGVVHDVVVVGVPERHDGRTTVYGMVLEVTSQGEEHVPTLTHRLGRLPDQIEPEDLPWRSDEQLPAGLVATVNLCLESSAPVNLIWGEDRRLIYNQAYLEIAGDGHPRLFGASLPRDWVDIWQVAGPAIEQVFRTGTPATVVDQLIPLASNDRVLDRYFTYPMTPVRGEDGSVSGVFIPIQETTLDVLRRRRLATLHELATQGVVDGSPEELYARLSSVLAGNPADIPFSLMYLIEPADRVATLQNTTGLTEAAGSAPEKLRLEGHTGWPVTEAISRGTPVLVDDVEQRFPGMLVGPAAAAPTRALISYVDLGHERLPNAINIIGVGDRQSLDAEYQMFLNRVARHLQADLVAVATAKLDRERSANLQRAMQSNRQIGAAIGILMTIHKVTEQQAFLLLSKASQQSNRKLRDIADDVILAGTLPPESIAPGQRRPNRRKAERRQGQPE